MTNLVKSTPGFGKYRSFDALAQSLHRELSEPGNLQWRSLSAKIGLLDKGETAWWLKRAPLAQALARLLEVSLADLGLEGRSRPHEFVFREFPGLGALDLRQGAPYVVAHAVRVAPSDRSAGGEGLDRWLGDASGMDWRLPHEMDWLHVADDLERRLLVARLAAAGRHEVVSLHSLSEAVQRLRDPRPLVACVEASDGHADLVALSRRPHAAGLLVVAPFMPATTGKPLPTLSYLSWERLTARGEQRRLLDLEAQDNAGDLCRWTWQLQPDWRARLLRWIGDRLNRVAVDTTSFDAGYLLDWLQRFDPEAQWLPATSDVLQIAQVMHRLSERRLPAPEERDAGHKLAQSLFGDMGPAAREVHLARLVAARWDCRDRPWQGPMPLPSWLALDHLGRAPPGRADLEGSAKAKSSSKRLVAALAEAGDPDALMATGLLRAAGAAGLDFTHGTLARLAVRDLLLQRMVDGPLAAWALDCYDAGRRPLVDAALDALPPHALQQVAARLRQEPQDPAVGIAASEALFLAVGRRIADGQAVPGSPLPIAAAVVGRLEWSDASDVATPWSRPCDGDEDRLLWIAGCWAWSLLRPAPACVPAGWQFPGWGDALSDPPWWLMGMTPPEADSGAAFTAWHRLLRVADEWLKDLDQPPPLVPPLLHMGLLSRAAHGTWPAQAAWWQGLAADKGAMVALLLERFDRAGEAAAGRLWPSFVRHARAQDTNGHLLLVVSPLWRWLLERLARTPAQFLAELDSADVTYVLEWAFALPARLRAALLEHVVQQAPELLRHSRMRDDGFFGRFGPEAAPALVRWLQLSPGPDADFDRRMLNSFAVRHLWVCAPGLTTQLLGSDSELAPQARALLLQEAPDEYLGAAIDALLAEPELLDAEERVGWVRTHLPNAGREAERLLALLG